MRSATTDVTAIRFVCFDEPARQVYESILATSTVAEDEALVSVVLDRTRMTACSSHKRPPTGLSE